MWARSKVRKAGGVRSGKSLSLPEDLTDPSRPTHPSDILGSAVILISHAVPQLATPWASKVNNTETKHGNNNSQINA